MAPNFSDGERVLWLLVQTPGDEARVVQSHVHGPLVVADVVLAASQNFELEEPFGGLFVCTIQYCRMLSS